MILDKESNHYLKKIIAEFMQASHYNPYQHIIKPQYRKQRLPSLFLWSPLRSFNVKIICPYHSVQLSPAMWTD